MSEDDPTFISDEENEAVFREREKTPQIDRAEALRRVIGNERASRLLEAEATAQRRASAGPRPAKPAYRARFQDSTDESAAAFREGAEGQPEVSDEEVEAGREVQAFLQKVLDKTGSFNIEQYLQEYKDDEEEARRLGLIE